MEALGAAQLVFSALVVAAAFTVRGTTGFGGNTIAVPLLTLVLPIQTVVAVVTVLVVFSSLGHWVRDWRRIEWKEIARVAPFSLIGVLIGLHLFQTLDPRILTKAFGIFVIVYAVFALAAAKRTVSPPGNLLWPLAAVLSTLAGVVGTLFGSAAGPLYVIYLNTLRLDKDCFRVTITTILMVQALMRIVGYIDLEFYDGPTFMLLVAGLPLTLVGARLGNLLVGRISQHTFSRIVGAVLVCSGIALVLK